MNRLQILTMTLDGIHEQKQYRNQSFGHYLMKSSFYRLPHSKYLLLTVHTFNKTTIHSRSPMQ